MAVLRNWKGKDMEKLRTCIVKMLKYPHRKRNQCSKSEPEEEIHEGYFHTWGREVEPCHES